MGKDKNPGNHGPLEIRDGLVLFLFYHLFDFFRQISVFQQIRNISSWSWHQKRRNMSEEEKKIAWESSKPFAFGYLFPEVWVLGNLAVGLLSCIILPFMPIYIAIILLIYALERNFEIFCYQVNVMFFDRIKSGPAKYKIKSATRMVILLILNMVEYIQWFAVIYIVIGRLGEVPDTGGLFYLKESMYIFISLGAPDLEKLRHNILYIVANIEAVVGVFMNLLCIARFMSVLPEIHTIDEE